LLKSSSGSRDQNVRNPPRELSILWTVILILLETKLCQPDSAVF
jgi:hypothetical protein